MACHVEWLKLNHRQHTGGIVVVFGCAIIQRRGWEGLRCAIIGGGRA